MESKKFTIFLLFSLFTIINSLQNYLPNPSFETLDSKGFADQWTRYKNCAIDTSVAHSGKNSIHCKSQTGQDTMFGLYLKNLFYGVKYKYSAYIRCKNIADGSILFYIESSNSKYGIYTRNTDIPECKEGTCNDKWYYLGASSVMIFQEASWYGFAFSLRPSGKASGEFWVDDVNLEMIETDILKSVLLKTYRSEVYKDKVDVLVDLNIVDSVFKDGDYFTVKVYIQDYADEKKIYQTLKNYKIEAISSLGDGGNNIIAKFQWDPSSLPENHFYTLKAESVISIFANKTETAVTYVKKLNKTQNYHFHIDEHNIAWKNGKKFFPIGLYFQSSKEEDLDYLKGSAVNVVKIPDSGKNAVEKIYSYTQGQVEVIVSIGLNYGSYADNELNKIRDAILQKIIKYNNTQGLIGYYIADEPGISNLLKIREAALTIREFDPDRFAWPALLKTELFAQWKELFDIGGIDCYPVNGYEALQDIWVIVKRARNLVMNNRAIWGIPQFFSWELYRPEKKYGVPSEDQLRQMTYQFIVAGCNGVIYYDFHEMKKMDSKYKFDEQWAKFRAVTDELARDYVPIILSTSSINPGYNIPAYSPSSGANSIGRRMWRYQGYDYLLIVNVRDTAINTTFTVPNSTKTVEKLMGKCKFSFKDHQVTLQMPAADVVWLKGYDTEWHPADETNWINYKLSLLILGVLAILL